MYFVLSLSSYLEIFGIFLVLGLGFLDFVVGWEYDNKF